MSNDQKRAVFLDRDGVINRCVIRERKPYPPSSPAEVEILPGVSEAMARLKAAGFLLICVTNQPDVARGKQRRNVVELIHENLLRSLPLDKIVVCYHDDHDRCRCRKPLAGMFLDAAQEFSINLEKSFMVGDRWRDIEAGQNAGCKTILIEYGYNERGPVNPPDHKVGLLSEAAEWILREMEKKGCCK